MCAWQRSNLLKFFDNWLKLPGVYTHVIFKSGERLKKTGMLLNSSHIIFNV